MSNIPRAVALTLLKNQSDHDTFITALQELIETGKAISKSELKERTQFSKAKLEVFYHYYVHEKRARIELRTSIKNKMVWNHKSDLANKTLSRTVEAAMTRVNIQVMPTTELNHITQELVRFNSLINQLARWCNTYKSSADAISVLCKLDDLSIRFELMQLSLIRDELFHELMDEV